MREIKLGRRRGVRRGKGSNTTPGNTTMRMEPELLEALSAIGGDRGRTEGVRIAVASYIQARDLCEDPMRVSSARIRWVDSDGIFTASNANNGTTVLVQAVGELVVLERYEPREDGRRVSVGRSEFSTREGAIKEGLYWLVFGDKGVFK